VRRNADTSTCGLQGSNFAVFSAIPPRLTEARVPGGFS